MKHYFLYKGTQYSGTIVSSTDAEPHFHWFLFDDEELVRTVSDSIAFRLFDGKLRPVHNYTRHKDLVEAVKATIEAYLKQQNQK